MCHDARLGCCFRLSGAILASWLIMSQAITLNHFGVNNNLHMYRCALYYCFRSLVRNYSDENIRL